MDRAANHVRALRWIAAGIAIGGVAVAVSGYDWALALAWTSAAIGWAEAARSLR
jgi:hypothetical protein